MDLATLDRPPVIWRYDRWEQDITFRQISAKVFAAIAGDFQASVHGQAADAPEAMRFYSELLSACVVSHQATPAEWLEVSADTLQTLGMQALRINHLLVEEAKKN